MPENYDVRVKEQIKQYANMAVLSKLPPIYQYWNNKFIAPRVQQAFGLSSIFDVYFEAMREAAIRKASKQETAVFYSIGAGDCETEINLAARLKAAKHDNVRLVCLELSPFRLARARAQAAAKGTERLLEFVEADLNNWTAPEPADIFIAHHSLHHLVALENLFDAMKAAMGNDSGFITADMIGRNGHMRWPETLHWVEHIWRTMPSHYKFSFQFQKTHEEYLNWDCSVAGFEGIRAQDVLPLIAERFDFDSFVGYGGVIDPFVDRGYGHNFDPGNSRDVAFIDFVEDLNQTLLEAGRIKPTMMLASFRLRDGKRRAINGLTPSFSIRIAPRA